MKGPWESIAAGREKGFKTQKLEKTQRHIAQRVVCRGDDIMVLARFQESEGCS